METEQFAETEIGDGDGYGHRTATVLNYSLRMMIKVTRFHCYFDYTDLEIYEVKYHSENLEGGRVRGNVVLLSNVPGHLHRNGLKHLRNTSTGLSKL